MTPFYVLAYIVGKKTISGLILYVSDISQSFELYSSMKQTLFSTQCSRL